MVDWSEISDEEIREECQRRVDRGDRSPDVYMTSQQCDDRAKVDVLRTAIIRANVAAIHADKPDPVLQMLASKCDELDSIYGNPLPERAFAINTAFYGKDTAFQDHSPEEISQREALGLGIGGRGVVEW